MTCEPRRFSIRLPRPLWIALVTVVVVISAVGVLFALPIYQQQMAVREIERLDGSIRTDNGGPGWLRRQVGDERMRLFDVVTWVNLGDRPATDTALMKLKCLVKLRVLALNKTQVTDAGLYHLRGLTSLHFLDLDETQLTDAGLAPLKC